MSKLYMVVGQDSVTKFLAEGWELYGSPQLDSKGWFRQAIVKDENAEKKGKDKFEAEP